MTSKKDNPKLDSKAQIASCMGAFRFGPQPMAFKIPTLSCIALMATLVLTATDSFWQDANAQTSPNQDVQNAASQKSDIQIRKSSKTADTKTAAAKTPPPVFSIEVPGPSQKPSNSASPGKSDDPNSRERAANQYFKEKQKQTISTSPSVKEASMRLSGSLCPACLKALAARFQKTEGVITASVELPSQLKASETETSNAVGKLPRYAIAHVTFDSKVLTVERIKDIIRTNDLAYWKFEVTEK
jgi:copper chaperone CopZ